MHPSVATIHHLVSAIEPADALEAEHRAGTLHWLDSTDDVYRRVRPAVPDPHLVSYVVPMHHPDGALLLVEHLNAGLWLPPGGHVEPGEHPTAAASSGRSAGGRRRTSAPPTRAASTRISAASWPRRAAADRRAE